MAELFVHNKDQVSCTEEEQEEIAIWTGVIDNGSIHGTLGMRLTMGIASTIVTGLCIGECMHVCNMFVLPIVTQRLLNKENKKRPLIDRCLRCR